MIMNTRTLQNPLTRPLNRDLNLVYYTPSVVDIITKVKVSENPCPSINPFVVCKNWGKARYNSVRLGDDLTRFVFSVYCWTFLILCLSAIISHNISHNEVNKDHMQKKSTMKLTEANEEFNSAYGGSLVTAAANSLQYSLQSSAINGASSTSPHQHHSTPTSCSQAASNAQSVNNSLVKRSDDYGSPKSNSSSVGSASGGGGGGGALPAFQRIASSTYGGASGVTNGADRYTSLSNYRNHNDTWPSTYETISYAPASVVTSQSLNGALNAVNTNVIRSTVNARSVATSDNNSLVATPFPAAASLSARPVQQHQSYSGYTRTC
uniref:Uncharacterized protein n=1 Tax=Glossina pallidipes TaxID=7398 RepID=A0A1A9ZR11_GLOPL